MFSGKQFQALAVCARVLLPTNLVLKLALTKDEISIQGTGCVGGAGLGLTWVPFGRWDHQSALKAVTRTSAGRLNGT